MSDELARGSDDNDIAAADKLKFFSEHVRGVLTLSSAAVPAIGRVRAAVPKRRDRS
jgi:hypothetical protein